MLAPITTPVRYFAEVLRRYAFIKYVIAAVVLFGLVVCVYVIAWLQGVSYGDKRALLTSSGIVYTSLVQAQHFEVSADRKHIVKKQHKYVGGTNEDAAVVHFAIRSAIQCLEEYEQEPMEIHWLLNSVLPPYGIQETHRKAIKSFLLQTQAQRTSATVARAP